MDRFNRNPSESDADDWFTLTVHPKGEFLCNVGHRNDLWWAVWAAGYNRCSLQTTAYQIQVALRTAEIIETKEAV
jgi:hypothetical protein